MCLENDEGNRCVCIAFQKCDGGMETQVRMDGVVLRLQFVSVT
jgi:hypothetical protein